MSSGHALAQFTLCGIGSGSIAGDLTAQGVTMNGIIDLDGSVDCAGIFCGGFGTADGAFEATGIMDGDLVIATGGDITMYECGAGPGGFSTLFGETDGVALAVGPSEASGLNSVAVGLGATANGEDSIAIGNDIVAVSAESIGININT